MVVDEKRSKIKGANIEDLGFWNPHTNKFSVKKERIEHWIKNGAQPTDSVHNILVKAKIIEGPKIPLHKKSKNPEATKSEKQTEEQLATEQTTAEQPPESQPTETPSA